MKSQQDRIESRMQFEVEMHKQGGMQGMESRRAKNNNNNMIRQNKMQLCYSLRCIVRTSVRITHNRLSFII